MWILKSEVQIRIRILPLSSKNSKEKPSFLLFCDYIMTFNLWKLMKINTFKSKKKRFNIFFVGVLKVTDKNIRIRIRIRKLLLNIGNNFEYCLQLTISPRIHHKCHFYWNTRIILWSKLFRLLLLCCVRMYVMGGRIQLSPPPPFTSLWGRFLSEDLFSWNQDKRKIVIMLLCKFSHSYINHY